MKTLLTICPYDLLPLRGGGALPCLHLIRQLARFYEVHAIIFQREKELRRGELADRSTNRGPRLS